MLVKGTVCSVKVRLLHLHPRNHNRLELPRPRRLGYARRQLQGQLVAPYIPRNLILRYTAPGDLVLDQMAGSGTTAVECKLLGLRAVSGGTF